MQKESLNNIYYIKDFKKKHNDVEQENTTAINGYVTNPLCEDLREQLMKFSQRKAKERFSVEDLLKW